MEWIDNIIHILRMFQGALFIVFFLNFIVIFREKRMNFKNSKGLLGLVVCNIILVSLQFEMENRGKIYIRKKIFEFKEKKVILTIVMLRIL